jgi:hypothetical protein
MNLSELGITVRESMTTPSRPGKKPRPVWVVSCPPAYDQAMIDAGGRKYNGAFSFWSDPTSAIEDAIATTGRTSFAERLEAKQDRAADRAERYSDYADNAKARADAAFNKADTISERFAMGQPILVGHHSEKRARKDQERMHNALSTACEETKKAEYWRGRAGSASEKAGERSIAFMDRRLKEAEANLRDVQRKLDGTWNVLAEPATGEWKIRLEQLQAEYSEQVDYWKAEIDAAGGIQFSGKARPEEGQTSIRKGDLIRSQHGWVIVDRVNPTSVSVTVYGCSLKVPYSEITEHKPMTEELAAKMQAAGVN